MSESKVVPREPTEDMLLAGRDMWGEPLADAWRAMYDAAPAAAQPADSLSAPASEEVEAMAKRGDAYAAVGDDPNYPDESAAMLRALDRERTEQKAEIARLRSEWAGIIGRNISAFGQSETNRDDRVICLNMIVKDEAHVIRRCLDSVLPYIDRWCIVDTGSTDGTQDIIREHLKDIPGQLHERPWVDFGHNRTEALALAKGDYLLFIDADEVLKVPEGFQWPSLTKDCYYLHAEYGTITYSRLSLVSTRLKWKWVGVIHEYLESEPAAKKGHLEWPRITVHHDGARAKDPRTYHKDAKVLTKALQKDQWNARYAFYLAQTWKDAGEPVKALYAYKSRAEMSGWDEETFYAMYEIGRMEEATKGHPDRVRAAYLAAYQFRPTRAEPLHQLARYHRGRKEWALAYLFASQAVKIPRPTDILFVEDSVYAWRCLDELSVAASYVAKPEGKALTQQLLLVAPENEHARIKANLAFYD